MIMCLVVVISYRHYNKKEPERIIPSLYFQQPEERAPIREKAPEDWLLELSALKPSLQVDIKGNLTEDGIFTFRIFLNKTFFQEFKAKKEELLNERLKALDSNDQNGYKNCVLNELKAIQHLNTSKTEQALRHIGLSISDYNKMFSQLMQTPSF